MAAPQGPQQVVYMVIMSSPSHDMIHVSTLDGSDCINGEKDMALENVREKLDGKPVVVGKFNHKGIPYGGDLVEIEYYDTKDPNYVGIQWKWANHGAPR